MARAWLIDGRSIARKVSSAGSSSSYKIKDCGAKRECPKCHYQIDNSDVSQEWPGLPLGVKFVPTDAELMEHLAAKCGIGSSKPHAFIDEFIPTIDGEKGICYTHPENLPGAMKDGSCVHFFHRTVNAYASGRRKRRKVHNELDSNEDCLRWHKTGKTKQVMANENHIGYKKIMVLYKSSKKGSKPNKVNWVMHQYHLGADEDEKDGEYVISKIFYQQQKQNDKNDEDASIKDTDILAQTTPRTPNPNPPIPPRPGKSILYDEIADDNMLQSSAEKKEIIEEAPSIPAPAILNNDDAVGYPASAWLAGESQAVDNSDFDCINDYLLCKELFDSSNNNASCSGISRFEIEVAGNNDAHCGISDLENIELDTPPDFQLTDLPFGSQDSIFGWLDRL